MTASVVVMNSGAVALATDSAVTIPYGSGMKHYQGACKLVASHAEAPVAVLWYGSPDYLGVPWEVIIKDYRHTRTKRLPKITDYAADFLSYLNSAWTAGGSIGTDEPPAVELARSLFARVEQTLSRQPADLAIAVTDTIAAWEKSLQPRRRVLTQTQVKSCKRLLSWLEAELDQLEETADKLPAAVRRKLRTAACSAWSHLSSHEPLHTGLVFAGFGEEDRLPAMCSYLAGIPAEGYPRLAQGRDVKVSSTKPAIIAPFAQNDQVRLFMEGLHPTLRKLIVGMLGQLEELGLPDAYVEQMRRLLGDHIDAHGRPVVDAVRFLPKADLAEFARALIAFTAFRLRMSMASESVGEPIDVAVVSRSEGVVWVHRSHYFPADLNPQFFSRY
jgi:hypothetical protein